MSQLCIFLCRLRCPSGYSNSAAQGQRAAGRSGGVRCPPPPPAGRGTGKATSPTPRPPPRTEGRGEAEERVANLSWGALREQDTVEGPRGEVPSLSQLRALLDASTAAGPLPASPAEAPAAHPFLPECLRSPGFLTRRNSKTVVNALCHPCPP